MDTSTLLRIYAGCARREIYRLFSPNSCIASTAITLDTMHHYGRSGRAWEVCLNVVSAPFHLELGCHPPDSPDAIGGHLVSLVDGFLVDASFGQITDANPAFRAPPVFVGELLPPGASLCNVYEFYTPFARLRYESRPMSRDYHSSPDWGPSPEREAVLTAILAQIEGYCQVNGLASPKSAT